MALRLTQCPWGPWGQTLFPVYWAGRSEYSHGMARPLRIEFANAIYHVMARGNARQRLFHEDEEYGHFREGLARTVDRCDWRMLAFACMPNHVHLLVQTPQANLSRGMQYLLSGYANWYAKRYHRSGHLFQGRFRGELIEDESYFWTISRYFHLNPVRGKRPLVSHPRDWPWSSYPGYADRRRRVAWVCYDAIYRAWQGEMGGQQAELAYRRFVEAGLAEPPENPLAKAVQGWLLGSAAFVQRIREQLEGPVHEDQVPAARRLRNVDPERVLDVVAGHYGISVEAFRQRHNGSQARDVAAWLARRLTTATLRELAVAFGLNHPDSVNNLVRRIDRRLVASRELRERIEGIHETLTKTGNRV